MPQQFSKKPVTIEAMQYDGVNTYEVIGWVDQNSPAGQDAVYDPEDGAVCIKTLEGVMSAQIGDWVIRGVQGEFYPCKPDIFEQTYEAETFEPETDGKFIGPEERFGIVAEGGGQA